MTGQPGERPAGPPAQEAVAAQEAGAAQEAAEQAEHAAEQTPPSPGFGERGRMRRRARFLRKARELAYRDLGGLVYDLHRFGQRNDQVVLAKLATLGHIDAELRALERALYEIRPVTVLREAGIAACPRCAAIHGNEDRFCPGCGLAFAAGADRPLSTAPVTATPPGDTSAAAPASAAPGAPVSPAPSAAPGAPVSTPASAAMASPAPTTSAQPTPARPATEPLTTIERPPGPTPALKPTAAPVAARPPFATDGDGKSGGDSSRNDSDSSEGDGGSDSSSGGTRDPDDEPTQVLRPPTGGV